MADNIITLDISGVDFNAPKFKMVGGLNIDTLKIKYNWIFNAQMEDAIIGEDDNGLVWYSGTWLCGTWEGGTWYSGDFIKGRWKDGDMYSYDIDKRESLLGNLYINRQDITKTRFYNATFEGGTFHYGIFGNIKNEDDLDIPYEIDRDYVIENIEDYDIVNEKFTYQVTDTSGTTTETISTATFKDGDFKGGLFNSAYFENGNFYGDNANNLIWYNGNWYDGCFLVGDWYNGNFFGGGFSNGNWYNGTFSTNSDDTNTRFGCNYKGTGSNWYDGTFSNGQFISGINEVDGVLLPSTDHSISKWYGGTFTNGEWFGGSFYGGTWDTGRFNAGIIFDITWKRGHIMDCVWKNGHFIDGTISGGIFENMEVENVSFGYDI